MFNTSILLLFSIGSLFAQEINPKTKVSVESLNKGETIIIGKLGSPIGTYHDIVASFGSPTAKGRIHQGGQILLKVTVVDGKKLKNPIWIPYFKSMSLQEYVLPDGTNIFPSHPNTHTLTGKTVSCRVYEDLAIIDSGNRNVMPRNNPNKLGFDKVTYRSILGIISINGTNSKNQ